MTTISSNSTAMSPADRMQLALQAAVSAGTVKSTDQSALSTALTNIDTSLQSATPPAPGTDPASIKDKVGSLIDDQVSNGTLTGDQATELKQVFAQASHKMGGGHHHHVHAGSSDPSSSSTNPIDSLFADLTNAVDSILGISSTTATTATASTSTTDSSSAIAGTSVAGSTTSSGAASNVDTR
jgi:hypothetical protein